MGSLFLCALPAPAGQPSGSVLVQAKNASLKRHLQKMGVKAGQVGPAFPAEKLDLAKNFRGVIFGGKGPIAVLLVVGRHLDILGDFNKMLGIAALLAGDASCRLAGGDVDFLHTVQWVKLLRKRF